MVVVIRGNVCNEDYFVSRKLFQREKNVNKGMEINYFWSVSLINKKRQMNQLFI